MIFDRERNSKKIQWNLKEIEIVQKLNNSYNNNRNIRFLGNTYRLEENIEKIMYDWSHEKNNKENERCIMRNDRHFKQECMGFYKVQMKEIESMMNNKLRLLDKNI